MMDLIWIVIVIIGVMDSFALTTALFMFYTLYLKPVIKYRHTKKNGVYTAFTLFDKGEYRGSIDLNLSELVGMLFNGKAKDYNKKHRKRYAKK